MNKKKKRTKNGNTNFLRRESFQRFSEFSHSQWMTLVCIWRHRRTKHRSNWSISVWYICYVTLLFYHSDFWPNDVDWKTFLSIALEHPSKRIKYIINTEVKKKVTICFRLNEFSPANKWMRQSLSLRNCVYKTLRFNIYHWIGMHAVYWMN